MAKNGPTERNLVDLIRISDEVLEAVLVMCGREDLVVNNRLLCSRHILIQMLNLIGDLQQVSAQPTLADADMERSRPRDRSCFRTSDRSPEEPGRGDGRAAQPDCSSPTGLKDFTPRGWRIFCWQWFFSA